MKRLKSLLALASLLAAALVSGCASVPMATTEEDALAKSFAVQPGKSNIYVYRSEKMFGAAVKLPVTLDGKLGGQTSAGSYFMWETQPGDHEISSVAETTETLKLTTEANKSYYIWQEVKMGLLAARSLLHKVDEETGRRTIMQCCKRVKSNF
jgi:hypothetical protein